MNIGDKVRFLNDVGGGKIIAFRPGGIVLVEDADGFDLPVRQDEVVVIEETTSKVVEKKKPTSKVTYGANPLKGESIVKGKPASKEEQPAKEENSLNGKKYLLSKTIKPETEEEEIDENLEARIVRLEMTIQKLEARIARLEAENNLRKNERTIKRQKPQSEKDNLKTLQIL